MATKKRQNSPKVEIEEMFEAGLHFGHNKSKIHPRMKPYLYGIRNKVYLIDLEKTKEKFEEALSFVKDLILNNKTLLLVGTKVQLNDLVKKTAQECNLPYVSERWIGGTFTNFEEMRRRIDYFQELREQRKEGGWEKYTKKEISEMEAELKDLERRFGGIEEMKKLPEAIFVLDMDKNPWAIKEANQKGIKIIAITDTNTDPTKADYPIPANNDARTAVEYILDKFSQMVKSAQQELSSLQEKESSSGEAAVALSEADKNQKEKD